MHNVFICQMNDFDTNNQKTSSFGETASAISIHVIIFQIRYPKEKEDLRKGMVLKTYKVFV